MVTRTHMIHHIDTCVCVWTDSGGIPAIPLKVSHVWLATHHVSLVKSNFLVNSNMCVCVSVSVSVSVSVCVCLKIALNSDGFTMCRYQFQVLALGNVDGYP